jgi:hypothetical protein
LVVADDDGESAALPLLRSCRKLPSHDGSGEWPDDLQELRPYRVSERRGFPLSLCEVSCGQLLTASAPAAAKVVLVKLRFSQRGM